MASKSMFASMSMDARFAITAVRYSFVSSFDKVPLPSLSYLLHEFIPDCSIPSFRHAAQTYETSGLGQYVRDGQRDCLGVQL